MLILSLLLLFIIGYKDDQILQSKTKKINIINITNLNTNSHNFLNHDRIKNMNLANYDNIFLHFNSTTNFFIPFHKRTFHLSRTAVIRDRRRNTNYDERVLNKILLTKFIFILYSFATALLSFITRAAALRGSSI